MSDSAFGYRLLRGAGFWGSRGLWLGVGIGAATVLAVTALARKGVRRAAACAGSPGEEAAAAAPPPASPEPVPVRAVRAPRKRKAKAETVPVRAVKAKSTPASGPAESVQAEVAPDVPPPAKKPARKRARPVKPAEPA